MKKFTLLFASLMLAITTFAAPLPVEGVIDAKAIPAGWEYITNNPSYPDPNFYSAGGLKMGFEGQGIRSPKFDAVNTVTVEFEIASLNDNTKSQGTADNVFTITALDATGTVLGEVGVNDVAAAGTFSATLSYTGIAQIELRMTKYVIVDGVCKNTELRRVKVSGTSTSVNSEYADQVAVFAANNCIHISGITEQASVEVYSIAGARVISEVIDTDASIACGSLNKGVYIVRVNGKASKITLR